MRVLYSAALAAFCVLLSFPATGEAETPAPAVSTYENSALAAGKADDPSAPAAVQEESKEKLVLLTWQDDPESVRYEVEIFRGLPADLDRNQPLEDHLYDNQRIYSNKVLVDLSQFPEGTEPLYWRVRPIDANWEGMGPFSSPMEVRSTMNRFPGMHRTPMCIGRAMGPPFSIPSIPMQEIRELRSMKWK